LRKLNEDLKQSIKNIPGNNFIVLDIGSVYKPYSIFFDHRYSQYYTIDIYKSEDAPNILGSSEQLPILSESVDVCLLTQVLEHVENPSACLSEISRVLKKDGTLVFSTHGVFHYHPFPHDYWRWTHEGLVKIASPYFKEISVKQNGGATMLVAYLIARGLYHISKSSNFLIFVRYTLYPIVNLLGYYLDNIATSNLISINYVVTAKNRNFKL
jgi:SAM-dependent methyltransferase